MTHSSQVVQKGLTLSRRIGFIALAALFAALPSAWSLQAQDLEAVVEAAVEEAPNYALLLNTLWVAFAAILVFWMQAGFAYVEGGFTRAKNANNIMMKNLMSICIGTIAFVLFGYAFMFGEGSPFIGYTGFFLSGIGPETVENDLPVYAFVFFQLMFAATAGTIVSGVLAERVKFLSYLVATFVITGLLYPIVGHWCWGGGWLSEQGFVDFAGSTVVHMTGGALALAGAAVLGARRGKFDERGKPLALPGHSLPMATLGVFILWMGWFGFNAGSTVSADASIALIAINTNLAAASGAIGALIMAKIMFKTYDIGMTLNGILAGLVSITAGCANVLPPAAIVMGLAGGALVVLSVVFFDKIKIDDPVGAVSVHGVCGALGTIMVGLFASPAIDEEVVGLIYGGGVSLLISQIIGVVAVAAYCLVVGGILFSIIKATVGLRVPVEEEEEGLDIGEHGLPAYPGQMAPRQY